VATTSLEPKNIDNLGVHGLIRPASVDDSLIPDTGCTEAVNVNFDRIGAVMVRPGLTNTWGTVSATTPTYNPCIGLHNAAGSFIIAGFKGTATAVRLYVYGGEGWNLQASNLFSTAKVRFIEFANRTMWMNGTTDSISFNSSEVFVGGNASTTGNPLNTNQFVDGGGSTDRKTASFGEVYKSRVYLAGDTGGGASNYTGKPSRLYFSSVADVSGNITWNPSVDYVDINPGDGEKISALKRYSLELVIYKPNYIYRFRTSGLALILIL
jgi:hypothetical protein